MLRIGYDSLSSWLWSLKEAKVYQKVFMAPMEKFAKKYFPPASHTSYTTATHGSNAMGGPRDDTIPQLGSPAHKS